MATPGGRTGPYAGWRAIFAVVVTAMTSGMVAGCVASPSRTQTSPPNPIAFEPYHCVADPKRPANLPDAGPVAHVQLMAPPQGQRVSLDAGRSVTFPVEIQFHCDAPSEALLGLNASLRGTYWGANLTLYAPSAVLVPAHPTSLWFNATVVARPCAAAGRYDFGLRPWVADDVVPGTAALVTLQVNGTSAGPSCGS